MSNDSRTIPVVAAPAAPCCSPSTSADRCCDPLPAAPITTAFEEGTDVRAVVRERYGAVASGEASTCGCCSGPEDAESVLAKIGYTPEQAAAIPAGANLGLGCGNPIAHAELEPGEVVLDLGSGAGIDCFLAAREVGPKGRVIGVDMTHAMLTRARSLATRMNATNVEFRLGEIEHLPVADGTIDVILSNCVINLSPEKAAVFREAFRALKPGGRLAISDVVATGPIPAELQTQAAALAGCIAGAAPIDDVRAMLAAAGFEAIAVEITPQSAAVVGSWLPGIEAFVASATIAATKPGGAAPCCGPSCCP